MWNNATCGPCCPLHSSLCCSPLQLLLFQNCKQQVEHASCSAKEQDQLLHPKMNKADFHPIYRMPLIFALDLLPLSIAARQSARQCCHFWWQLRWWIRRLVITIAFIVTVMYTRILFIWECVFVTHKIENISGKEIVFFKLAYMLSGFQVNIWCFSRKVDVSTRLISSYSISEIH